MALYFANFVLLNPIGCLLLPQDFAYVFLGLNASEANNLSSKPFKIFNWLISLFFPGIPPNDSDDVCSEPKESSDISLSTVDNDDDDDCFFTGSLFSFAVLELYVILDNQKVK